MDYEIELRTVSAQPTAVVAQATTWEEYPRLWGVLLDEVYAYVRAGGTTQTGHNVMLYLDDIPHVEVGIEVDGPFASSGRVVPSVLPAGRVATTVHRGPYGALGDAHAAVIEWCTANGHPVTRARWEVYGDWHEDPAALETEIYYLLD